MPCGLGSQCIAKKNKRIVCGMKNNSIDGDGSRQQSKEKEEVRRNLNGKNEMVELAWSAFRKLHMNWIRVADEEF